MPIEPSISETAPEEMDTKVPTEKGDVPNQVAFSSVVSTFGGDGTGRVCLKGSFMWCSNVPIDCSSIVLEQ